MKHPLSPIAHTWLVSLSKGPDETRLFAGQFNQLLKLIPGLKPTRTIYTNLGKPAIVFFDRKVAIEMLKNTFAFHTIEEASNILREEFNHSRQGN